MKRDQDECFICSVRADAVSNADDPAGIAEDTTIAAILACAVSMRDVVGTLCDRHRARLKIVGMLLIESTTPDRPGAL